VKESEAVAEVIRLGGKINRNEKLPGRPVIAIDFPFSADFRDMDMHLLSSFKELQELSFSKNKITSAGLKDLGKLKSLTSLAIAQIVITDAQRSPMRACWNSEH